VDVVIDQGAVAADIELEDLSAVGAGAAVASSPGSVTELTNMPPPKAPTAAATGRAAARSKDSSEPTGATATGMRRRLPKRLVEQSTLATSRRTRVAAHRIERLAVALHRRLGLGRADQIVQMLRLRLTCAA